MTAKDILQVVAGIVASLGGGAVIVFALSNWLGKVWADRLMAAEQAKHAQALENLRGEIRKVAFEAEVRFTKLHEQRAQVIAELFGKVGDLLEAGENCLRSGVGPSQKVFDTYYELEKDFLRTFRRYEIYLPEDLCKDLRFSVFKLGSETFKFDISESDRKPPPTSGPEREEWMARFKARYWGATQDAAVFRLKLTNAFRDLLGVDSSANRSG